MFRQFCLVCGTALALAGCDMGAKQDIQYDDSRNPYYKQAQQDLESDPTKAAADYEAAIGANPSLTEAHYQLGHIYAEKLNDPAGSIFHFQQYLKLAPTGEKADEAKGLIEKESQAFAASLPGAPSQTSDDYARAQSDNAALKKQIEAATVTITQLQSDLAQAKAAAATPPPSAPVTAATAPATNAPAVSTNAVAAAPAGPLRALPLDSTNFIANTNAPPEAAGPSRTYKVVKGDKLWTIAHKLYPGQNTKDCVEKIQDANKDTLGAKPLKIGQVLIIPQ